MQVGVSTASLFMRKNNEEALPLLSDLGVECAEVFLTSFSEYGYPFADILKSVKGDLNVYSVHALNTEFEPQLFSKHPRVKADAYGWAEKVLESAVALGAKHYTFHGTSRVKRASRSGKHDDFPSMIAGFAELSDFCESRGVSLCLENVEWSTYNRLGVFRILANEIPKLRGVLDIKQARISEQPWQSYLDEMGERLSHVHISDVDERGKMCLPGQGLFPFEELVKLLQGVGFDGAILVEVYNKDYKEYAELKKSVDFVKEILYKYDCSK